MRSTRGTNAALAALLAAGTLLTAPSAQAAETGAATESRESAGDLSRAQRPLVEAAEKIRAAVDDGAHPGFAGIVLEDDHVTLWWKGRVPPALTAVVARVSRAVPVRVAAAAHSRAEIAAAAAKVRAWLHANPGTGIHGVKSAGDGSGLVLAARPGSTARSTGIAPLRAAAGVPVSVRQEEPMTEVSRQDDAPPWSGGTRTWNQTAGTLCTSGFGVRDSANRRYILTAEHCGQVGSRITDRTGELIGTTSRGHDDHDIGLVPASSGNTMYVGGGNSNTKVPVTGWGHVFVGQYLCQSGVSSAEATGGPVCNLKVIFFWQDREDLVEAEQTQGLTAARPGDSGGSVYSTASGGVVTNGTVTRTAGARIGFQDFATANRDFGVTIP
ncbi:hypothetical protein Kfla_4477 [Kribbella flavida DSM 17836]|uniref:Peptidase S1 and S6 chymotrypsin/Hap n=1 Tax=Kribbella flavida (strain DSM 17836 / JCM 10339 / NBRC 14399) TaxID=479435 RepID=D2PWN8_KRIFD|nr:hypothetical protein [Kribbella flavida]ADB33507.1 hypothetical protein Kfla_4477 [Kribbella flavida DSM 17836]